MKLAAFFILPLFLAVSFFPLYAQTKSPEFPPEMSGDVLYDQGLKLCGQEKYPEAAFCFEEAAKRKANFAEAYYQLGFCCLKTKQFDRARQNLTLARVFASNEELKRKASALLTAIPAEMEQEKYRQQAEKARLQEEEKTRLEKEALAKTKEAELKKQAEKQAELERQKEEQLKTAALEAVARAEAAKVTDRPASAPAAGTAAAVPAAPVRKSEVQKLAGRLVRLEGTVDFRASAKDAWKPAVPQMDIGLGCWLQTAGASRTIISFGPETIVTLNENSLLEVKELERKPDGAVRVKNGLSRGKVWSLLDKLKTEGERYQVETPTAVAGARGTTFMVTASPDGLSGRIAVVEGEVAVMVKGDKPYYLVLKDNNAVNVVYNKPAVRPEALEAAEKAEWDNWKQSIPFSAIPGVGAMAEMHAMQMEEAAKLVRETGLRLKGGKKAFEDFKVFREAVQQYYRDVGAFPLKEPGLKALIRNPGVEGWTGPYLDPGSNFKDPYGYLYQYRLKKTPNGKEYVEIRSPGLDGSVGDEDDEVGTVFAPQPQSGK